MSEKFVPMVDLNGPFVDRLIASLLRSSVMLSEIGHALKLDNPESAIAGQLIFEADAARTEAQKAMAEQNLGYQDQKANPA